jgi:hypothetical protein
LINIRRYRGNGACFRRYDCAARRGREINSLRFAFYIFANNFAVYRVCKLSGGCDGLLHWRFFF